jgi:hypothetical protein
MHQEPRQGYVPSTACVRKQVAFGKDLNGPRRPRTVYNSTVTIRPIDMEVSMTAIHWIGMAFVALPLLFAAILWATIIAEFWKANRSNTPRAAFIGPSALRAPSIVFSSAAGAANHWGEAEKGLAVETLDAATWQIERTGSRKARMIPTRLAVVDDHRRTSVPLANGPKRTRRSTRPNATNSARKCPAHPRSQNQP